MRTCVLCLMAFAVLPINSLVAQEERHRGIDEASLLQRIDVSTELGIIDDQSVAMRRIITDRDNNERLKAARAQSPELFRREMYRLHGTAMNTVLTQNQLQRLDELRWQYDLLGDFGTTLGKAVKLDDKQKQLIAEKEAELGNELQKELQAFYRKSQRDLQELLTSEQQDKWKELVGLPFEFQPTGKRLNPLGSLR